VRQVHHAAAGVDPAVLTTAPGLDADASALLGGRPDAAGIADSVTAGEGTLEVRSRAETTADAVVVAGAVGTVLSRRAATGPEVGRTTAGPSAGPVEDLGTRPPPGAVLGGGAAVALVIGVLAGGLASRTVSSTESLARRTGRPVLGRVPARGLPRDPAVLAPPPGTRPPSRPGTPSGGGGAGAGRGGPGGGARGPCPRRRRSRAAGDHRRRRDGPRGGARAGRRAGPAGGRRAGLGGLPGTAGRGPDSGRTRDPRRLGQPRADGAAWSRGGIDVLPAGASAHRGAPPLDGDDVASVLGRLRDRYDRIVVDAPGDPGARAAVEPARAGEVTVLVVRRPGRRRGDGARRGPGSRSAGRCSPGREAERPPGSGLEPSLADASTCRQTLTQLPPGWSQNGVRTEVTYGASHAPQRTNHVSTSTWSRSAAL
jgi:hypothetical protein